jgi:trehalose 6-phosphate synthase/phosphatase
VYQPDGRIPRLRSVAPTPAARSTGPRAEYFLQSNNNRGIPLNMTTQRRLLIVSNRLPVTIRIEKGRLDLIQAAGGLATGLRGCHERSGGLWLGWPGDVSRLSAPQRTDLEDRLSAQCIVPLHLSRREIRAYYDGFSNGVLWPLFHYLLDRIPLGRSDWDAYRAVNEKFAEIVKQHYEPGDMVWIHDYQLMLVPGLLRRSLPEARIGFFLHIPFPSDEVFRILPWRRELLEGLLGADLIGFHTYSYVQHFAEALSYLPGVEPEEDRVWLDDREVRFGVFPMGIDAQSFRQLSEHADVQRELASIREEAGGRRILLGVDRLDYTKGIPRRLAAFERLLAEEPALRDHVRLVQVAVPSRGEVPSYQEFRRSVEEMVGRINGAYGTVRSAPIHYLHQSVPLPRLVALYRAADVMLVTPLRDGMNLVAKEFIASRMDDDGVLVLSEFAGAAAELSEAVLVNPYDVGELVTTIKQALAMGAAERGARMRPLRRRVMSHDVHRWVHEFVRDLSAEPSPERRPTAAEKLSQVSAILQTASSRALLLDYDGTLVPIAPAPDLAPPDRELIELLRALAARPATVLHLVSGRAPDTMEAWFGQLPIALWAEHGTWHRAAPGAGWHSTQEISNDWMNVVRPILDQFTLDTPGSFVEEKLASIAWHYRRADRRYGRRQARELRTTLAHALLDRPVDILEGKKVVEIRPRGSSKAVVVQRVLSVDPPPAVILAIGDDRTDEEMFAALPASGIAIHVGPGASLAARRLSNAHAARAFLAGLID